MKRIKIKKELKEWGIFAVVLLLLYVTGLHTEVAAFAQRMVLATGIANPDIEETRSQEKAAYDFTLDGLNGETLDFETVKGKVVFINFWATWCAPCIAEMPSIQALYDNYKDNDDVVFVMINVETDHKKAEKFINKKDFTLPVYFPNPTRLPKVYESKSIPTTFVLDKEGFIAYKKVGIANYSAGSFSRFIESLLNQPIE